METSQNQAIFNFLSSFDNPPYSHKKIINTLVWLNFGSVRKLARNIGYSHTVINKVINGYSKYSEAAGIIFAYLDIDNPYV